MACFLSLQASRSPAWLHLEDVLVTRWTPVPALSGVRSVWFSFKNAESQRAGSLREDPRGPAEAAVGLVKARGLVSLHLRRALLEARLTGGARRSLPRGPFDGQRLPAPCEPPPRAQRLSSCPPPDLLEARPAPTRLCIVGLERIAGGTPGPPLCTAPSSSSPASRGGSARPTLQPRFPAAPSASPASRALVSKVATGRSRGRA